MGRLRERSSFRQEAATNKINKNELNKKSGVPQEMADVSFLKLQRDSQQNASGIPKNRIKRRHFHHIGVKQPHPMTGIKISNVSFQKDDTVDAWPHPVKP